MNSTIAFICMLIVAGSGFIGRFLYSRIHRGLYGRKASVRELVSDASDARSLLGQELTLPPELVNKLNAHFQLRLGDEIGLRRGLVRAMLAGISARRTSRQLERDFQTFVDQSAIANRWTAKQVSDSKRAASQHFRRFTNLVADAEVFTLYDRLFSYWHMLHLPLFIILVLAACAHVFAVHLY